jgi:hypothetical protein
MIRRRDVIYVEAYDPQGAEGYYNLFCGAWKRSLHPWQLAGTVGSLKIDSADYAHWTAELSGPNWRTTTRYSFLRQERMIRANMAQPIYSQLLRALSWAIDDLFSGTLLRIFRASWQFGLVLIYFQTLLLLWVLISGLLGVAAAVALTGIFDGETWLLALVGIPSAFLAFILLRPFFARHHIIQINNHWPYLREFGRGAPTSFDTAIEAGATRLVETARANEADEVLVVGHSGGCVLAPAIVTRALELEPDLGSIGPRIVLLTLGSIMPAVALHPDAIKARRILRQLALEPRISWVDCQSRKDVLNFWNFDPIKGVGIEINETQPNPQLWRVRFRDMVSAKTYRRLRLNFLRLHYQFIMGGDRRAAYDYILLTCGPLSATDWAIDPAGTLKAFSCLV